MAMLEIKNLHKSFGTLEVLKGVSLEVEKGDVVAILGPSGSGKTTFLRCVNFLETADQGEMIFDGEPFPLHGASKKDIARFRMKTAFVFQNYNLFRNKTAIQNVTEGLIVARKMPKAEALDFGMRMLERWALPTGQTATPASSPADSSSVWPLPGAWLPSRRSSSSMSLPPPWTRSLPGRCWLLCAAWPRRA